jgi:hypothetical protein
MQAGARCSEPRRPTLLDRREANSVTRGGYEWKVRGARVRRGEHGKRGAKRGVSAAALSKGLTVEALSVADRCDDGEPERDVSTVPVPSGSSVSLRIVLCGSPAAVAADLDGHRFLPPADGRR